MKYELLIALKYLRSKKQQKFISLISFISIFGIAIGVCALLVVVSVMNGFDKDLMKKILGMNTHLSVERIGGISNYPDVIKEIQKNPAVKSCSPVLLGQAMLRKSNFSKGIILKGIDIELESKTSDFMEYIKIGEAELFSENKEIEKIILGQELAKELHIFMGDTVNIISSIGVKSSLVVSGIFASDMYDYDSNFAFISLDTAQKLFRLKDERISSIQVMAYDANKIDLIKKELETMLDPRFSVSTWFERNKSLFSALKLEKTVMFIILTLIILVAAFNIISALIMVVMEKKKDIGILKSMGASPGSILAIFSFQGLFLGLVGVILGMASGLGICYLLDKVDFIQLPSDVYYITKLPVAVDWYDVIVIITSAFMLSFLAAIYPALKARNINPVEALRWE